MAQFPKVCLTGGSFNRPSPLPPHSYRETNPAACSNQGWESGTSWMSGSCPATFTKLRGRQAGRHVNICRGLLSAWLQTKQKYFRRNPLEALPFSQNHVCLGSPGQLWGIGPAQELSCTQCIVYKYSGRLLSGVVRARESGVLKASFSSGYGGT